MEEELLEQVDRKLRGAEHVFTPCGDPKCSCKFCKVCRGNSQEKTLTTECSTFRLNDDQRDAVQLGVLDFMEGKWIEK